MKIKTGVIYAVAVFLLTAGSVVSMAQNIGFHIGIAQPVFGFPPTQAPVTVTQGTFIANPVIPPPVTVVVIQNQVFAPNPVFVPTQIFTPNQVFIPNQVFTPNPVFVPNQLFLPTQVFAPNPFPTQVVIPNQILVPGQTVISAPAPLPVIAPSPARFGPPFRTGQMTPPAPAPGTSRAEVLRQFGQPAVSVSTSTGETLFFNGGITVTLQNGQVTGPK